MNGILSQIRSQWIGTIALFLVVAGGSAYGGTLAARSALNKKEKNQAKNIANAAIQAAAPTLSVASSKQSGTAALGGTGRQSETDADCDVPGTRIACTFVTLQLSSPARVLVNATAGVPTGGGFAGDCELGTTSGPIPDSGVGVTGYHVALTGVTGVLPAGTHSFGLDCLRTHGPSLTLFNPQVTAVALSAN